MNTPLISVIIPTYGGSETLIRAIESVLIQNFSFFEVIVIDDNNSNSEARIKTEKMMSVFNDSRLIYLKHDKNRNGAAARNTGIKNAQGKYITFLDDDDLYLQNKLKKQFEYLEMNQDIYGCYCWRQENGKQVKSELEGNLTQHILSESFTPCTMTLMFKKDVFDKLNGFDETYRRHQDYEFLIRYFKHFNLGLVKEVLVERSTNEIDNMPHGKKLLLLKRKFLSQFKSEIEELNKSYPGFKKKVYFKHYFYVFADSFKKRYIYLTTKIFFGLLITHPVQMIKQIYLILFKKKESHE